MRWSSVDRRAYRTVPQQFFADYEIDPPAEQSMGMTEEKKLESGVGVLKFFLNETRGFGFISREGLPDVFLHVRALKKAVITEPPAPGTKLAFDLEPVEGKAPQAVNIRVVP